ncbi:MAG: M28 family peptidase, partial [Saprospiraceae bacterium]|nr:M28 family peptidase [Saprospiraceae bacterium]
YISSAMARDIIGKKENKIKKWRDKNRKKGKTCDIKLKPELYIDMKKDISVIKGYNVLGFVEGTDKKDEVVIVSAHFDHLGKRGNDIYNGADDNASGTCTVLEMAEAMARAKSEGHGPRRSILFLLVTGEEKGLLGSRYYSENPIFDLKNTVANVNVDMVGRTDKKYENNPHYIYVIGSDRLSSDLHQANEDINQKYSQLTLDYRYNDANDPNRYYFRSDHYNFAKKGIPAIFFFSGTHKDYHRTSDTAEKILYDKMERVGRHIFHLTWDLANSEERIKLDSRK